MSHKILPLVVLLLAACDPAAPVRSCASSAECGEGELCVDGRCREATPADGGGGAMDGSAPGRDTGTPAALTRIELEPATASLTSVDGAMVEQAFSVVGVYDDGTTRPVAGPTFSIDPVSLGVIDVASGRFVANGVIGGEATVTATVAGPAGELSATATVSVTLERTIVGDGVPADVADRFLSPVTDDARRAQIAYPLDGAVMPQNVYPADVQWLRGAAGDIARVTLSKPHLSVTAYVANDGSSHWLVDEAAWRSFAQTDPVAPGTVTVRRRARRRSRARRSR